MSAAATPPAPGIVALPTATGGGFKYPELFTEATLASELSLRLAGRPASSVTPPMSGTAGRPLKIVWVDAGSDVLVHLDSVKTKLGDGTLLVSVDLESDQTGRASVVVVFALGRAGDPAGLLAVTDETPRGRGILVARWGAIVKNAVWAALLGLVSDFAAERNQAPSGFAASTAGLRLLSDPRPPSISRGN